MDQGYAPPTIHPLILYLYVLYPLSIREGREYYTLELNNKSSSVELIKQLETNLFRFIMNNSKTLLSCIGTVKLKMWMKNLKRAMLRVFYQNVDCMCNSYSHI